jgi:hypothetical protein
MVTIVSMASGDGAQFWDVDGHVAFGSRGDDVRFVQYLMVRTGLLGLSLADVDGVWGARTAAAMSRFEQMLGTNNVLADGAIDPIPPGSTNNAFVRGGISFTYKLSPLYDLYVQRESPRTDTHDPNASSAVLLSMPFDGQCPPALAAALVRALSEHPGADPSADGLVV